MPKSSDKRSQSAAKLAKLLRRDESNVVSAAELRHNSAELVSRAAVGGERIVLTRNRKPVAALVPMADYESLKKSKKPAG